ncbi:unnamed protein product [Closterium sp. NIES-64]|nr:unnamed protein product [Closterium sp. NIES-64]
MTMIGPAAATLEALRELTPLLAREGLTCNFRKSSAWSTVPLGGDVLPEGLPLTREGVRVLGSLVGSQSFCSDFVRSTLTDAAAPLGSLASIHPQHALLLLSRCISRRVGYLLRTTPADVLPLSEWHTWCAELLNTALTAASIQSPRRQAEFNFLLRQATLPVALGGLGLTDPTNEVAPAYLASTTEALRLLRSLELPATAPLGADSNALQPFAAHSVTIQDMEGRLPPLALQNLREEQQTPSQDQLQRALSQEVHAAKADTLREESRTPPATIGGPGSPWELPSSAEVTQTREHGETTRQDHAEQEEDAAEQTEPTAARHQHLRSPSPQAAAALNAPGIQRDCGAGAWREGRREQREELMVTPTPYASDEAPSPRHQAYPEDGAPLQTALDALFRRDCHPPVAHDAHAHLRSSAQATAGKMGPADAGGQENGPRDEGSRAVGALQEGANAELGADA